jgi:hypothetical protein
MGYDFIAKNKKAGDFYLGAFSFPVLIEACGYLFACIKHGAQWYCVFGQDPRMGDEYPRLLSNDGFEVTDEEAKIMARIARNFVAVQRSLPEANRAKGTLTSQAEFRREDVVEMLMRGMHGTPPGPWPEKIRNDFTDNFEKFAEWAERSGGFEIR